MARQISQLTAAGAITPASDLLWLEQGGLPRKVTVASLSAAMTPTYQLSNNQFLQGENLAGGTFYDLIGINTADWVEIGEPTRNVQYDGTLHKYSAVAEHYDAPGGTTHKLRSTVNWTSGTLNLPFIRWEENDGTTHGGIRAYTTTGLDSVLELGTGFFNSKLALSSADEHIMTGHLTINGTGNELTLNSVAPKIRWEESDATANNGWWDIVAAGEQLLFRIRGDGDVGGENYMTVTRTTTTVSSLNFNADTVNWDTVNYMDLDAATTTVGIRLRTSGTQRGYIYADTNGIGILNDAGGWSIQHRHTDDAVRIYGNLLPGSGTGYFQSVTGNYGSVEVNGAEGVSGTWIGFNAGGRAVFMAHPTEQRFGLYDDVDNRWAIQWNPLNAAADEQLYLYCGANSVLRTQSYTATGNTSAGTLWDRDGVERDIGFNDLPPQHQNASYTLDAGDCGTVGYHNNTTAYTVTLAASTNLDFPVGGMHTYVNHTDTAVTIAQGTGTTLIWQHGGTGAQTGNRTVSGRAAVNIWRYASTAYFIWGNGIS